MTALGDPLPSGAREIVERAFRRLPSEVLPVVPCMRFWRGGQVNKRGVAQGRRTRRVRGCFRACRISQSQRPSHPARPGSLSSYDHPPPPFSERLCKCRPRGSPPPPSVPVSGSRSRISSRGSRWSTRLEKVRRRPTSTRPRTTLPPSRQGPLLLFSHLKGCNKGS